MKSLVRTFVIFLLYLLVFVLLVDPADVIFKLKLPLFLLILVLWCGEKGICKNLKFRQDSVIFVFAYIVIPVISILIALAQDTLDNKPFAFGFIKSVMIMNLLFVLDDYDIAIDKILIHTSIVLPILTILIYFSLLVDPQYFEDVIFPYFSEEAASASFSLRNYYGFEVAMFFFKSSPLLVFPLGYYTYQMMQGKQFLKYFLLTLLVLFTLFLSGTRANILGGSLIFVILVFENLLQRRNKIPLFVGFLAVLFLVGIFIYNASFEEKEISQQVKSEHVASYINLFQRNPQYLIWGQGLGSEFFSKGFGFYTPQTELTYLDIIRMFGIPLGLLFIILTVYPIIFLVSVYKRNKEANYLIVVYAAYLFIAGTNPLLISSTGILAILSIFSTLRGFENSVVPQFLKV